MKLPRLFTANSLKEVYTPFYCISKLFGFSTFAYRSETFKHSRFGVFTFLVNICYCFYLFSRTIEFFRKNLALKVSKVLLFGILVIEVFTSVATSVCLIINFFQRKKVFLMMKRFEKFDEKVEHVSVKFESNCLFNLSI